MGSGSVSYKCEFCGKEFRGSPSRSKAKHICCSKKCMSALIISRSALNCKCPICGKEFHLKPSLINKTKTNCCSKECLRELKRFTMAGEKNHQYGLKGDKNASWKSDSYIRLGYKKIRVLDHPFRDSDDFVPEHRLVAEKYLLTEENSIEINGKRYLKPELEVHHIDENKLNNSPGNLLVLTKSEHRTLHNKKHWIELGGTNKGKFPKKEDVQNMTSVFVKRINVEAKLPTRAYKDDAGWDLYSVDSYVINPGETVMVDSGLAFSLPKGTFGAIYARSGLATKFGLRPANCVGICDSGYTYNYIIPLHNDSNEVRIIHKYDRIAQLIVQKYVDFNLTEVDELSDTDRGTGGFGSSGV